MNRLVILFLFLAAGAFGLYVLLFKVGGRELPAGSDAFAIFDTAGIQKIEMVDKSNREAVLERRTDWGWSINGKYKARLADVKNLLETMHLIRVVRRIPQKHHDPVVANLASNHTRVRIWNAGGKMREYYVGYEAPNNEGNYMWKEGLDEVYIVNMPGFVGHLTSRYFTEEDKWRDSEIFSYGLEEISKVRVTYHKHPTILLPAVSSFAVHVIARDSFSVTDSNGVAADAIDKRQVVHYLGGFGQVNYEALANDLSVKDSVLATPNFCTMSVTDKAGKTKRIRIWFKPVSKRTKLQYDPQGNPLPYDRERFYALVNDGRDFVIIQEFVFGKLLASYEWFLVSGS